MPLDFAGLAPYFSSITTPFPVPPPIPDPVSNNAHPAIQASKPAPTKVTKPRDTSALGKLRELMEMSGFIDHDIQVAVGKKGFFPMDMPLNTYPEDFISEALLAHWDQFSCFIIKLNESNDPDLLS
jgi:hypothetical protein